MKALGWIWILTGFFLQTFAQPVDFSRLERSMSGGNRMETKVQFSLITGQLAGQPGNTPDLLRLLKLTRELSRSGMADLVWPGLKQVAGTSAIEKMLTDSLKWFLLSELGAAYFYDNQYRQADSVFRLSLTCFRGPGRLDHPDYAYSCNFIGLTAMRLSMPDSALVWFEKAKTLRMRYFGEDHPLVGAIYNNLGILFKTSGDFNRAVQYYQKAIDIKKKTNEHSVYLNLLNLGELYGIRGQYKRSMAYYRQADSILSLEKPSLKQADLYLNSGAMMYYLQGYQEALDYFMKALRIYESLTGDQSILTGKAYQNLANVYSNLGDRKEEMKAIEKSLNILERELGPDHADLAPLYNNLGMAFQNTNRYDSSLYYLNKARAIYRPLAEDQTEKLSNTLLNMAQVYFQAGMTDSAVVCYRQSIEKMEKHTGGRHPYLSAANNFLALIYMNQGYYQKADSLTDRAIVANFPLGTGFREYPGASFDPGFLFESWILKGKISWKSDPLSAANAEKAFFYFRKADSLLSFQRNFLFNTSDKITFSKNTRKLAESSLECLAGSKWTGASEPLFAEGFRFAEKSRNLVLLQTMQDEEARQISGIPDSILSREEELRGNISALNHQLETSKGKSPTEGLEDQLFVARNSYRLLIESMEKEYPEYRQMKYSESVPSVSVLQKSIGDGVAFLAYFTGDSAVYRFVLTNSHFYLERSGKMVLEDLITGYRKGITLRLDNVFREKSQQLYQVLFPGELPDRVNQLVIVPDGALAAIPFEALLFSQPQENEDPSAWPFLVKKYIISYTPSLAIREKLNQSRAQAEGPSSFLAFAPEFKDKQGTVSNPWMEPLPSTREEILRIDTLFRENGRISKVYLSDNATESNLLGARLQEAGYLHMATHGFVNEKNPGLSGLYLYPSEDTKADQVLYLGEIYQLKLNARLVTLSACETGLGKLAPGEGVLGFSRAFLLAGARNLLLSLWKVNDASTSELMTQFYKFHLENGSPLAESLRKSKLSLIGNTETSHPYFWAGFVLTGN